MRRECVAFGNVILSIKTPLRAGVIRREAWVTRQACFFFLPWVLFACSLAMNALQPSENLSLFAMTQALRSLWVFALPQNWVMSAPHAWCQASVPFVEVFGPSVFVEVASSWLSGAPAFGNAIVAGEVAGVVAAGVAFGAASAAIAEPLKSPTATNAASASGAPDLNIMIELPVVSEHRVIRFLRERFSDGEW
jgi:hypothetical protein